MDDRGPLIVALLLACLLGIAGAFGAGLGSSAGPEAEEAPKPFDPLSEAEEARAIELASANASVADRLGPRTVTIGAALHTWKVHPISEMPRRADVWFYDYEADEALRVVVDLGEQAVHQLIPLGNQQPPLTAGEIDRAASMALEDPRVEARLSEDGLRSLGYLWTGDGATTCRENRCVLVAFVVDGQLTETFVRVNLSEDQVEAILEPPLYRPPPQGGAP